MSRRGMGGTEAFFLWGIRPAVSANNAWWTTTVFYAFEIESLRWESSCHLNWSVKPRNESGARCGSCLMHTGKDSAVGGHAA